MTHRPCYNRQRMHFKLGPEKFWKKNSR